jgi:hypothetical protein
LHAAEYVVAIWAAPGRASQFGFVHIHNLNRVD